MSIAYQETTASSEGAGTTSHGVDYPATVNANDILIAVVTYQSVDTGSWPAGWTKILDHDIGGWGTGEVAWRRADGTEGGGSFTVTTTNAYKSGHQVLRFSGAHTTTAPEVSAGANNGDTTAPDPDSLNPGGWGTEETMWIAVAHCSVGTNSTITVYPTNYSNGAEVEVASAGGGCSVASATRLLSATSEDPGAFTADASANWWSETVGIRPAAAAAAGLPSLVTAPYRAAA